MRKSIIIMAMAIGLSFAGVGIADATPTTDSQQCTQARTALDKLQNQANAEKRKDVKAALNTIIGSLTTQVNRLCSTPYSTSGCAPGGGPNGCPGT